MVKPEVRRVQAPDAVLAFDDSIEEKPHTDEADIPWNGAWNVTCPGAAPLLCSDLVLVQVGDNVTGSFIFDKIGANLTATVSGTVTGDTLTGTYTFAPRASRPFSWTLEPSGQQFKGTWASLGGSNLLLPVFDMPFCGTRPGTALPSC